jgi:hypothetical protein
MRSVIAAAGIVVSIVFACIHLVFAEQELLQPLRVIDCHTAGMLSRAHFALECRSYPNGDVTSSGTGVTLSLLAALTDRINIGLGYGGDGIIGRGTPTFNPHIGAMFKLRIIEESYYWPAFAIGYDHQGFGGIDAQYNGYIYKSAGFFCAISKNYLVMTALQIGLHGGVNYSLEECSAVKWPNAYVGADVGFNEKFSATGEYDCALNVRDVGSDSTHVYYANPLKGFLNLGIRWFISSSFCAEADVKDLLRNKVDAAGNRVGWGRELKLTYIGKLF